MKLLYALPLLTFIGLNSGAELSVETQARIAADWDSSCTPSGEDCYLKDPVGDYMIATVTFDGAVNDGSACCYTYTATHDLDGELCLEAGPGVNLNPSLSHLNFDTFCDGQNIVLVSSTKGGTLENMDARDGSTCYRGFKFDVGFDKEDGPQTYQMCITWDGWTPSTTCETRIGWYMIKAGGAFDFEEIQVPSCDGGSGPTPPTCPDMGAALEDNPHSCVCVPALADCPRDNNYCKSLEFVAGVLGEGPVSDPCGEGEICCCNCPVCPLS